MLSFEFVFSGGIVEPWESHWFNYAPATASVMETEWLTDSIVSDTPQGSLTRDDLMDLGRAPTYEEIMSVITEYPGPDEPVYVPAADEAIWLTDLDGHAEIYDNDSIRINYADWFDQSEITRIEVYRNGIKLRFLPDMLDVITNEQMKTFDGNPLEHTPASSHTDHAIFGYEYEFRLHVTGENDIWQSTAVVRSPFRTDIKRTYAHVHPHWNRLLEWEKLSDQDIVDFFMKLSNLGFNGVSLTITCFVASTTSNEVFFLYQPDRQISWWSTTATDSELRRVLELARESDLEIAVRMALLVSDSYTNSTDDFAFSGNVCPSNVDAFIESYGDAAVHVAQIAEEFGCKVFTPLTEMNCLEQYPDAIKRLYDRIDHAFSGELAFEEGTHHYLGGFNTYNGETRFDKNVGTFWDWTSSAGVPLGIEWSCWSPPLDTQMDQRLSSVVESMFEFWEPAYSYYSERYPMNPVRFGEIGVYGYDGVSLGFISTTASGKLHDEQEVADIWAAYIIYAHVSDLNGVFVWDFRLGDRWYEDWKRAELPALDIGETAAVRIIASLLGGDPTISYSPQHAR